MDLPWFNSRLIRSETQVQFRKGLWLTLILSATLLVVFYGRVLFDANQVYFSNSGDGLQSYFSTLYQLKHDSSYWRMSGMNYPYGENSFFTGNQPLLTASIKLISANFFDISPYAIGIINLLMLLSIVVCALALYGIFHHLGLPYWYSAIVAVCITFISPQIHRMGGHYSLAYPFAIPLFMLMLLKFYKTPTYKHTAMMGVFTFIMAGTHLYFFCIFALLLTLFYTLAYFNKEKEFKNLLFSIKHYSLQIILPFISIWVLINMNDFVTDRPQSPMGFLHYRSAWEGVLLPIGRPLGYFIHDFIEIRHVEWEGRAFVGMVATIFTLILLFYFFRLLFKKRFKQIFTLTDHPALNMIFWSSILALLYSFGFPFILKMQFLIDYIGIFKQIRGIGRFNWIFFYTINIVCFYLLYEWTNKIFKAYKNLFLVLPLTLLSIDVYYAVNSHEFFLNNKIEKLSPEFKDNLWSEKIDPHKYQAIIPLPYFAVGSENLWILPDMRIIYETLIASYKSGIPTTGSILARTSLSQTFKHLQMVQEPYRELDILEDLKDERPFLILAIENALSEADKQMLKKAEHILTTEDFSLYELPFSTLKNATENTIEITVNAYENAQLYNHQELQSTDSLLNFLYTDFEKYAQQIAYKGKGAFKGPLKEKNILLSGDITQSMMGERYIASFWFYGFRNDIYPRSIVQLEIYGKEKEELVVEKREIQQHIKLMDKEWALIEFDFIMPENRTLLELSVINKQVSNADYFYADDILIRPENTDLYKSGTGVIVKNNRYYFKK